MSRSSWLRLGAAVAGAGCFVGSFFFPPAAGILAPLGTFGIGYAMRTAGDISAAELRARGEAAAVAAHQAAVGAVRENSGAPIGTVAAAAGVAAAEAAAQAFAAPR